MLEHTHDIGVALLAGARGAHCIGLAGARLAVCEDRDIVALDKRVDAVGDVLEDALLVNVLAEDAVEDEDLPAAGRVDGQARGGCDVTCGGAESLGDELVARLAGLEGRADTDGCEGAVVRGAVVAGGERLQWGTYRL